LYAFGSVLTPNFNTNSDVDLIVDFKDIDVKDYADNYFDFKFTLQDIFKRKVDLLGRTEYAIISIASNIRQIENNKWQNILYF
jgi:predicted nucleotidyltransferase